MVTLPKLVTGASGFIGTHTARAHKFAGEDFAAIDLLTLISKLEGLGLMHSGALASEVPLISANNSTRNKVVNSDVAIKFEASSVPDLELVMQKVIDDLSEARQSDRRGKIRVQQYFGVDSIVRQVGDIYSRILQDSLK